MPQASDHSLYVPDGRRLDDKACGEPAQSVIVRCCGYMPRNRNWNFSRVFSPFWRLYYNFSPGHHVVHERASFPLRPDRFLLIPADTLFQCRSPRGACGHLYLHFDFLPPRPGASRMPSEVKADVAAIAMARKLATTAAHSSTFAVAQRASALLHWVLSGVQEESRILQTPSSAMERALSMIRASPGSQLPNQALARAAGVSVRGLARIFASEMNCAPHEFVREYRLREAARRLARGDGIEAISDELGYPNRAYFTRRFAARFGCPPAAFRKTLTPAPPPSQESGGSPGGGDAS